MSTRVRLCGPLAVEVAGRDVAAALPGGQASMLFAYLVAAGEASRDELIAMLWPERPPRDPGAALRPLLSRLRSVLGEDAALAGRERLRLTLPTPVWSDVGAAAEGVARARASAQGGDWPAAARAAEAAAELLRPGFLPGVEAEWANARRRELEELALEALELAARSRLALGDGPAVERAARELVARSPYRETGHRFLMEALAAAGNVAEALRAYEDLRVLLRDELGATPAAEVQAVHRRLLTGETVTTAARAALPGVLAPGERSAFVGRAAEREELHRAWDEARAGRRRLVLLGGEPGIGKTRLLQELAREAHAGGAVLSAACAPEPVVSFQPFVEALRETGLDALAGDASLDPDARRFRLFEAVSAGLDEQARTAPLLLVLDDLHWADRPTLQLLRHVVRGPAPVPLLIAGAYRESEVGADHPLAELLADLRRDRLARRVSLAGLSEGDVRALIATHAGHEAPPGVVRVVHAHTDGNPFFVEEVMRHLIETGALYEREGRWASALTADELGVPEGVREVVLARVERLPEDCRAALAQGAVLGREFRFDVLRTMSGIDEDVLIAALEAALAAQLLVEAPGPAYAFTHALVREVVYARLSAPRRERLHARAAAALEAAGGAADGRLGALALHLRAAGSGADAGLAVDVSLRAGERAAGVSAWEDAAAHWEGALAVLARAGGRERERAGLLVALADVLVQSGDLGRRIAALDEALALYEQLGDAERAAQVHSRLGNTRSLIDSIYADHLDIPRAFAHFDAARAVLAQGPARRAAGHLEAGVANALMYVLGVAQGLEAAERAMEIGERTGDELLWAGAAQAHGWHSVVAGRLSAGLATLERSIEVADRHRRSFLAVMGCNTRGQLTWGLGAPSEAQAFIERPLSLPYVGRTAYEQEIADGVGRCLASRGELAAARQLLPGARPAWLTHALAPVLGLWDGRWEDVRALAASALAASRRSGNRWDEFAAHHLAARVDALEGRWAAAAAGFEQALTLIGDAVYFELWVRPDLARALAAAGRVAEAREHVERSRAIVADGEDWRGRAGHMVLAHAEVLAAAGDLDPAAFAAAHDRFVAYELRGEQAEALVAWARALERAGASAEASERRAAAADVYRACGAAPVWLTLT